MGTRNTTITGLFLRKRLKRHIVLRLWDWCRDIIKGREQAAIWEPSVPCRICQTPNGTAALFCSWCGAAKVQETEALELARLELARSVLPVTPAVAAPDTGEFEVSRLAPFYETKLLFPVRIGELRPALQYQAERHAWLHASIRSRYPRDGEELIAACDDRGYAWLIDQLRARGDTALVKAYQGRPVQKKGEVRHGEARH
jgi:hypothetical protein